MSTEFQETKRQIRAAKAAAKEAAAKEKDLQEAEDKETDDEFVKVDMNNVTAGMAAEAEQADADNTTVVPEISEEEAARIRQLEVDAERKRLKAEKIARKKALLAARPVVDQRSMNAYGALNEESEEEGPGGDNESESDGEDSSLRTSLFGETVRTARPEKQEAEKALSAAAAARNQKKKEAKKKKRAAERAERTEQNQQSRVAAAAAAAAASATTAVTSDTAATSPDSESSTSASTTKTAEKVSPLLGVIRSGLDAVSSVTILLCILYFACLQLKINPFSEINKLAGQEIFTTWAKQVKL